MAPLLFFVKARSIIRQSPRWVVGAAVVTPTVALMQGIALLQDYRNHHSDLPYPVSPSQGLVVSVDERKNRRVGQPHQPPSSSPEAHEHSSSLLLSSSSSSSNKNNKNNGKGGRLTQFLQQYFQQHQHNPPPPLRLLVIGDSLAAGVGVTDRATPVLPESIARTLSQNLGGRPVYWTCIGRPGAAVDEIIHSIETHDHVLLVQQATRASLATTTTTTTMTPKATWWNNNFLQRRQQRLMEWWKNCLQRHRQQRQQNIIKQQQPSLSATNATTNTSGEADDQTENNTIQKKRNHFIVWWNLLREDIQSFVQAWRGQRNQQIEDDDSYYDVDHEHDDETSGRRRRSNHIVQDRFQIWQYWKQRLQRRGSRVGKSDDDADGVCGQYDIAIVLLGANDLKHAWLPFMMSDHNPEADRKPLQDRLQTVVKALRERVKPVLSRTSTKRQSEIGNECVSNHQHDTATEPNQPEMEQRQEQQRQEQQQDMDPSRRMPLVVFPAIPITLVPQLNAPPIRWFVTYVFQRLENCKKSMAEKFPGEIVFVEPPCIDLFTELEAGEGKMYEDLQAETVLLKLTNVSQRMQENFEMKLQEYRDKIARIMKEDEDDDKAEEGGGGKEHGDGNDHDGTDYSRGGNSSSSITHHPDESFADYEKPKIKKDDSKRIPILACDQVHPSDEGYEIWGRHIASEVLKQWKPTG